MFTISLPFSIQIIPQAREGDKDHILDKDMEVNRMDFKTAVALFIAGIAVGIALHRFIMAIVLENSPDTPCAYCEWLGRKKSRHKK